MKTRFFSLLLLLAAANSLQAAPPNVMSLFPAGAQRGQTVEITAAGTFDRWPAQAWVSGKGISVKSGKDKGKFSVTVAADAMPGMRWFRAHDDQGGSNLRPFFVGTLPEVQEKEPNDDPKKAQAVDSSVVVNGKLSPAGDVDGFAVKLKKGQTLVASVEANRTLGSPMDAVLQLLSPQGFVVDQNHDYHDLDPQLVYPVPADGIYVVRLFAFPAVADSGIRFAGADTFLYRLTLTTGGYLEYAWPLMSHPNPEPRGWNLPNALKLERGEPDGDEFSLWHPQLAGVGRVRAAETSALEVEPNDRTKPQTIELPVTIGGRIDAPGDVDVFRFTAKKGQKLTFTIDSRQLGFPLDAVLKLTDASGSSLQRVDDPGGRRDGNRDAELTFTPTADGTYHIEVSDLYGHGGFRYVYRLRCATATPDYGLTLAADRFVFSPAKPLDIPVTIDRRNGFDKEIELKVESLPDGVTASPVKATGSGKTATLKLTATKAAAGAVRIVGTAGNEARQARAAVTGFTATTAEVWVQATAK